MNDCEGVHEDFSKAADFNNFPFDSNSIRRAGYVMLTNQLRDVKVDWQ